MSLADEGYVEVSPGNWHKPVTPAFKVYAVVDCVDYEGHHVVRVFQTRPDAENYAQKNYRKATGRMSVDVWEVFDE